MSAWSIIKNMQGQIFKIHSDFYYIDTSKGVYEAKIRDVLKKRKDAIVVGDFVELEQINENFRSKLKKILKIYQMLLFIWIQLLKNKS